MQCRGDVAVATVGNVSDTQVPVLLALLAVWLLVDVFDHSVQAMPVYAQDSMLSVSSSESTPVRSGLLGFSSLPCGTRARLRRF